MKKIFYISVVTSLICFNSFNYGMENPTRSKVPLYRYRDITESLIHLDIALKHGYSDIIEFLNKKLDPEINKRDEDGNTPLLIASTNGNAFLVKLLIKAGVDVNQSNYAGLTPLFIATKNNHVDVVRLLIEAKADVNKEDKDGNTPLHEAVYHHNRDIIKLLIEAHADVDKGDIDGWTPLHIAAHDPAVEHQFIDIITLLIEAKADVNKRNKNDTTPLHKAAGKGNVTIANLLLNAGAQANQKNNKGQAPLHLAAIYGHMDMVLLLLSAGTSVHHTMIHWAKQNKHDDIATLLTNHTACIIELDQKGVDAASKLADKKNYDSHVLYNCILNAKVNGIPLPGPLGTLSLPDLRKELDPLISDLKFSNQSKDNTFNIFCGWKKNINPSVKK